ncbi:MAG: hypothetical protein ACR2PA_27545 [Hyphomicrobiaceae bacterium]
MGIAATIRVIKGDPDERLDQDLRGRGELAAICNKVFVEQAMTLRAPHDCENANGDAMQTNEQGETTVWISFDTDLDAYGGYRVRSGPPFALGMIFLDGERRCGRKFLHY